MPAGLSASDFWYILPELVLTAGALVLLIVDVALRARARAGPLAAVTLVVLAATGLSLQPFASSHVEVAHGLLAVDQFAFFFKIVFLLAAAVTVLMSVPYLDTEGVRSPGEYYFLILCAVLGMMIMAGG